MTGKISQEALFILAALESAVAKELEKKRRLGHYYVTWENGQVIFTGEDAPKNSSRKVSKSKKY